MKASDVVIIGGGIVGVSAAYFLAQRGVAVVLLEKDTVGSKASGVNFGGLRVAGRDLAEIPLSLRAMQFWRNLRQHLGHDSEVEFSGHLEVSIDEKKLETFERWNEIGRQFGLAPEMLTAAQLRERYPYLGSGLAGGCLMADDGSANPRLATPLIAAAARRAGADIREHSGVTHSSHDGHAFRVLAGAGEEFKAPVLINAAGAWAGKIAESYGDSVPWLTMAPQMTVSEPLPFRINGIVDCDVGVRGLYLRQHPRGNVFFGGGPGRADLEAERAFVVPQNVFNGSNILLELIPFMKPYHIIRTWSGVECKMPDALPVLDTSRSVPGLIHAFGFSGHGFQLGPGTGGVLADLATQGRTSTDISGLRIDRFKANTAP